MNKKTILLKLILLAVLLMNSCAVPVSVSVPIVDEPTEIVLTPTEFSQPTETDVPTEIPLPTSTSAPVPTETSTPVPTETLVPVYTELGMQAVRIAYLLGWDIVECPPEINYQSYENGDWATENGIFALTENTNQFFCNFKGYVDEPVPEPLPGEFQFFLSFAEYKGLSDMNVEDGFHFDVRGSEKYYYPSPSTYSADEIVAMRGVFETYEDLRNYKIEYAITVRMWPLTVEQKDDLYNVPEEEMLNFWFEE